MSHALIAGMTQMGKSTLAEFLIRGLVKRNVSAAVFDPLNDPRWKKAGAIFVTNDPTDYLRYIKTHKNVICFIDESGLAVGRHNAAFAFVTTTARHLGHATFLILHRLTQIDPVIRSNCGDVFLFKCGPKEAEIVAEEWAEPRIRNASQLTVGEFYIISRFKPLRKGKILFDKRGVRYDNVS